MNTLLQDLRYGARMLMKNPSFTLVAILALTLGIGATTAIFSVVNSVLLKPLPYPESERLVYLWETSAQLSEMSVAYPNYQDWRAQNDVFEHVGVYRRQNYNLTGSGEPERLIGGMMSAELFTALRINPLRGRVFTDDEDKPGAQPVVVLSYGLWQRRFGGDPGILDQQLMLNDRSFTVIGIMPPDFRFPTRAEMWTPVGQSADDPGWKNRGNHPGLYGFARLKPGVTIEQARASMESIAVNLEKQFPDSNTGNRVAVTPALEVFVGDVRPALIALLIVVALVLLIACTNVANLLMARATARQKEMAIRTAMGASRWRIVRQLLTESLLLSFVGGALGLLLATWGVRLIVAISPNTIPRSHEITVDTGVLVFTIAVAALTGMLFGLAPALQASKPDLNETLKDAGRGSTGRRHILRNVLVVAEVAMTLLLLVGAGLMVHSFYRLQQVDPGFNVDNLLTFSVELPPQKYPEESQRLDFFDQAVARLRTLPGVETVGVSSGLPLGNNGWQTSFVVDGQPPPEPGKTPVTEAATVSPDYFRALGITILQGRNFTDADAKGTQRVALVDEEFARRYFDGNAIGKHIRPGGNDPSNPLVEIVGVVRRVKMEGLKQDSDRVQSYYPFRQLTGNTMTLTIKTAGDPMTIASAVREQMLAVNPNQPISNLSSMQQLRADSIAPERLNLTLFSCFAVVALLLASVGIYGVMSYSVTQRTHEIGIRMALGAQPRKVLGMVIRQGMLLTAMGLAIGVGVGLLASQFMASLLFGISATDPLTFLAIPLLLAAVALGACFIPARRATRIDPMIALRYE